MTRPQRLRLLWSKYPFDGSHAVFMLTERMDRVMAQELASAKSRPDIKVLRKTRESHSAITYSNIPCRILALYLGKKNSLTTIKMTAGSLTLWIACRDRLAQKRKHWLSILASSGCGTLAIAPGICPDITIPRVVLFTVQTCKAGELAGMSKQSCYE